MTTYKEFVSRFPLQEKSVAKEGYEYHHIIPKSVQEEPDDSGVLLLPSEHLWAHVLYDRENGTETSKFIRTKCNLKLEDIHSYEDCLVYDKVAEIHRKYLKDWAATHDGRFPIPKDEVRMLYSQGISPTNLAKEYKCSRSYIYQILDLKNKKELDCSNLNSKYVTMKDTIKSLESKIAELQEENNLLKSILKKLTLQ